MKKYTKPVDEITEYECYYGFKIKIPCSNEETKEYLKMLKNKEPLPEGVYTGEETNGTGYFFTVKDCQYNEDYKKTLLMYRGLDDLNSIKRYTRFFFILTIIALVGGIVLAMILTSH